VIVRGPESGLSSQLRKVSMKFIKRETNSMVVNCTFTFTPLPFNRLSEKYFSLNRTAKTHVSTVVPKIKIFDNKEYSSTREWSAGTSFPFSEQPSETIIFEPTTESTAEARFESTTETTIEPTTEPTTESTAEARSESTTETTIGRPTKPTTESTAEARSESTTETTIEPTTEPTTKSTAEARSESTTETTIESTTESTTELRAEPTTKSTTRTSTTSQTSTTQNVDRRKKRSHESGLGRSNVNVTIMVIIIYDKIYYS
jgi:hypothetical protein